MTLFQAVPCILMAFAVGLYVGAFVQRRRDSEERQMLNVAVRKLTVAFMNSNEKIEEKNEIY